MTTAEQTEVLREGRIHAGFLNLPVQVSDLSVETVRSEPLCIALALVAILLTRRVVIGQQIGASTTTR